MIPSTVRIFVCMEPPDMRRSFDGLALAARQILGQDPRSGAMFVFTNRRGRLKGLFRIERAIKEATRKKREQARREQSQPLLDTFFQWCDEQAIVALDGTPISKALGYARNQRVALCRLVDDGRLPLDNNISERNLRREVLGSDEGARQHHLCLAPGQLPAPRPRPLGLPPRPLLPPAHVAPGSDPRARPSLLEADYPAAGHSAAPGRQRLPHRHAR